MEKTDLKQDQINRRFMIEEQLEWLNKHWEKCNKTLENIGTVLGADASGIITKPLKAFFTLGSVHGNTNDPVAALARWTQHRLVQLEGLEALSTDQKKALGLDPANLPES